MTQERISLDDLLARQAAPRPLAVTIEATGDADRVKVTPFDAAAGCACDASLAIRRDAIDWLQPTGETHECCGKSLTVVEIGLKDETLADVLRQLAAKVRTARPPVSAAAARSPAPPRMARGGARYTSGDPIGTPEEGQTGYWNELVCGAARKVCMARCRFHYRNNGEMRAVCQCECENDYGMCLDPHYGPQPCFPV